MTFARVCIWTCIKQHLIVISESNAKENEMASKTVKAKQHFIQAMTALIGQPDTYGNYKFVSKKTGATYRFAIRNLVWRFERRVGMQWRLIESRYFSDLGSLKAASDQYEKRN